MAPVHPLLDFRSVPVAGGEPQVVIRRPRRRGHAVFELGHAAVSERHLPLIIPAPPDDENPAAGSTTTSAAQQGGFWFVFAGDA